MLNRGSAQNNKRNLMPQESAPWGMKSFLLEKTFSPYIWVCMKVNRISYVVKIKYGQQPPLQFLWVKTETYLLSLIRRWSMKCLASSDISSKLSSSKSNSPCVTFDKVSTSESPMNGDNPDNLCKMNICIRRGDSKLGNHKTMKYCPINDKDWTLFQRYVLAGKNLCPAELIS